MKNRKIGMNEMKFNFHSRQKVGRPFPEILRLERCKGRLTLPLWGYRTTYTFGRSLLSDAFPFRILHGSTPLSWHFSAFNLMPLEGLTKFCMLLGFSLPYPKASREAKQNLKRVCRCSFSFLHRAPQGSTRKYEFFSSLRTQTVRPFPFFRESFNHVRGKKKKEKEKEKRKEKVKSYLLIRMFFSNWACEGSLQ